MSKHIQLGIDIGATGIKGGLINPLTGEMISERYKLATPESGEPKEMASVIKNIVEYFKYDGLVGCGFPGVIQQGTCKTSANLSKAWINKPIEKYLHKRCGVPFAVANDADLAGLAEIKIGKGKGIPGTVLLITIGTGLGSALFFNGELIPNTELGHLYYKRSVYEHYASNSARKRLNLSWSKWAKEFSGYINHLQLLVSPDLFILGGGISKRFDLWGPMLKTNSNVVPASLLNNAGIIGAAYLADLRK